jgi:hypothetical protein
MSQQDPIRVFVTHNWHDTEDYLRVFEFLESSKNFFYRNTSTPDTPPSAVDSESIRTDLRKQIDAAEIVVALASLYARSPDLTIFQMNYAQSQKKPVLLMGFFGVRQDIPKLLVERAEEVGEWNDRQMVDMIRKLARGENTQRFDSVEFNPDEFKDFKLE